MCKKIIGRANREKGWISDIKKDRVLSMVIRIIPSFVFLFRIYIATIKAIP